MEDSATATKFSFEHSVWCATARPAPDSPPVAPHTDCDVIVIGGGIAGAVATATLALGGANVVLLEAERLASGATGRSGGYIVPSFPVLRPHAVLKQLGSKGEQLIRAVARSADFVFDFVREHELECDAGQNGWIHPTTSEGKFREFEADKQFWQRFGASMTLLGAKDTEQETGIDSFAGSLLAKSGGTIHPVKFVHEAVKIAVNHGARFLEHSRALSMKRCNGRWQIRTADLTLSAEYVLVCTNGQSPELTPELYRSFLPTLICHSASQPITESERRHLFGQGRCLSDTRVNLFTYRFDADWRLISGALPVLPIGRGKRLGKSIAKRLNTTLNIQQHIEQEFVWFGRASVTDDFLPRAYELGPGAYSFSACNGRGLAISALVAHELSHSILSGSRKELSVPLAVPIPFRQRTLARTGARLYPVYGSIADHLRGS